MASLLERMPAAAEAAPTLEPFRLGEWWIDPASGEVAGLAGSFRIEPRMMEVLVHLVRHGDRVVSKDELLAAVWNDVYVTEDAVWRCIAGLRRALGDDPRSPRFIETLPRRGYRLVAPVTPSEATSPTNAAVEPAAAAPVPIGAAARWTAIATASLVAAGLLAWTLVRGLPPAPTRAAADGGSSMAASVDSGELRSATQYVELASRLAARRDDASLERAAALYREAIARDPSLAAAHAGLADAYALLATRGEESRAPLAEESALRALAIDPGNAHAHKALGLLLHGQDDLRGAARHYETALDLDPGLEAAANNLAGVLLGLGELDRALHWQETVEPASPEEWSIHLGNLAYIWYLVGDPTRAERQAHAALAIDPAHGLAHAVRLRVALDQGQEGAAEERLAAWRAAAPEAPGPRLWTARLLQNAGDHRRALATLEDAAPPRDEAEYRIRRALSLARLGREEEAGRLLATLESEALAAEDAATDRWTPHLIAARVAALRGDSAAAIAWLERAAGRGFVDHRDLASEPALGTLHGDPRFERLVARLTDRVARMRERVADGGAAAGYSPR